MNFKKLIDLYLEGDLNSVEKDLLFRELSTNQDLREYFEDQINFNQVFLKDYQAITVPSELTNEIFAKLNFKIPNKGYETKASTQPTFITKFKTHFSKFIPYFASSILGSICTFLLLWLFIPMPRQNTTTFVSSNLSNELGIPVGQTIALSKPLAETNETKQFDKFEQVLPRILDKYFSKYLQKENTNGYKPIEVLRTENQDIIEPTDTKFKAWNITQSNLEHNSAIVLKNYDFNSKSYLNSLSSFGHLTQKLKNITLGFRGYSMNSQPTVNVNLGERGLLTNAAISIGYDLFKNTNVGFEFGQEKFSQQYTLKRYGELTYYKQNPLLWWYGFYLQQTIENMFVFKEMRPFARIFLGGTPVGPLFRGSLGMLYAPDERFSLHFGWEVSYLSYKVQDNFYHTKKNGITYGFTLKY